MTLLVTGAAGFIGSHFVLRHQEKFPKDKVVVLDKLTYAADKNLLKPVMDKIIFVEGDMADPKLVGSIASDHNVDTIVNFAAETHVDLSIKDPWPFIHSNVLGTQSLIDAARANPKILLLHISTDEIYGDLKDGEQAFGLDTPFKPSSPYAATKAAAEHLVAAAIRTYGIRARVTRCTNNYGPHQDKTKLLPVIIRNALADKKIPIYAKGLQRRDWLYVTDHTDAIELVLSKGKDGGVYLVSADDERLRIEVTKTVLKILKKPESLIEFVTDRPGHDWRYALDSSSTRALGWKPAVSFEEGVRRAIEWFQGHSF